LPIPIKIATFFGLGSVCVSTPTVYYWLFWKSALQKNGKWSNKTFTSHESITHAIL